jgi:AsmA protein
MKWGKRILIALAVLVVLLLIAPVIALITIDPNSYRPLVERQVQKATGRTFAMEGDLDLSLFPRLTLELGSARLGNAPGFGDAPFAQIGSAAVGISVWPPGPLLKGQIEADKIIIDGLTLDLHTKADGTTNWDDLASDKEEGKEESKKNDDSEETADGRKLSLALAGIEVSDATLRFRDERDGTDITISPVNISTGEVEPGEPFDLKADLIAKLSKPVTEIKLDLAGEVTADPENQRYKLSGLKLKLNSKGADTPAVDAELSADASADLAAETVSITPLNLKLTSKSPDSPPLDAELNASAAANLKAQTLSVAPLKLSVEGVPLSGELQARQIKDAPTYSGKLAGGEINLRELLKAFGGEELETADPNVLKKVSVNLQFSGTPDKVSIPSLAMTVDQTALEGNAEVTLGETPFIAASLHGTSMDLDRYLPPEEKGKKGDGSGDGKKSGDEAEEPLFPVDSLRGLNLKADLKFDQLKLNDIQMTGASAVLSAQNGLISLAPVNVKLFEGGLSTQAKVDVRGASPTVSIKSVIDSVRMGPLLRELTGDEYLTGLGKVEIDLTSQGMVMDEILRQLDGNIHIALSDGTLRNSKLSEKIATAIAFFKQGRAGYKEGGVGGALKGIAANQLQAVSPKAAGTGTSEEETQFTTLNGSFNIVDGVMRGEGLDLISRLILAKGSGTINLGESRADYVLQVGLNEGGEPKGGRFAPITIKGPFDNLSFGLDVATLAKEEVRQQVEERKEELIEKAQGKLQEKLEDKLGDKLKDKLPGLGNLFGRPASQSAPSASTPSTPMGTQTKTAPAEGNAGSAPQGAPAGTPASGASKPDAPAGAVPGPAAPDAGTSAPLGTQPPADSGSGAPPPASAPAGTESGAGQQ